MYPDHCLDIKHDANQSDTHNLDTSNSAKPYISK